MTGGDIVAAVRRRIAEPSPNRWSDADLLALATQASDDIAMEVDFPDASYVIYTVANQREYQMIEHIKITRVYLQVPTISQTPLPGTDLDTLEGNLLMLYDQSSGSVMGDVINSPQWLAEPGQPYPLTNSPIGGTVPSGLPYSSVTTSGQRGMYYLRGGFLGVVPPPSFGGGSANNSWWIVADHIPIQPAFNQDVNLSIYPRFYTNALVARIAKYCYDADKSPMSDLMAREYQEQVSKLRIWRDNRQATKPKRFMPITRRTFTRWGDRW